MTQPKVSIITPSYNQGQFIEETILSAKNQDYPNIEHIVIDGNSTDSTLDILHKYDNDIIWISEPDRGQSDALNKGFRIATGEIIGWLNSDDIYLPGAVKKAVDALMNNPKFDIVYGDYLIIDENSKVLLKKREINFDHFSLFF